VVILEGGLWVSVIDEVPYALLSMRLWKLEQHRNFSDKKLWKTIMSQTDPLGFSAEENVAISSASTQDLIAALKVDCDKYDRGENPTAFDDLVKRQIGTQQPGPAPKSEPLLKPDPDLRALLRSRIDAKRAERANAPSVARDSNMQAPRIDHETLTPAEKTLASNIDAADLTAALSADDPSAAVNDVLKKTADQLHDGSYEPPPVRKEATYEPPVVGARVRLVGLVNKPELNNRVGTITHDRSGKVDGRVAVAVDGLEGPGIRLKKANISVNDAVVCVRDSHQRRVLREQISRMDANATASGRMGAMEKVLAECQAHRGLEVKDYGSSPEERLAFWNDLHSLTGTRPDFVSSGILVSAELNERERAILREGGYDA
jgi:hypothetical protein